MSAEPSMLMPLVKMIASLSLVLGLILAALWALRRWTGQGRGPGRAAWIRILATQALGPRKAVSLVRVPGAVLVLGLSADRIVALDKITDPAILARIDPQPPDFKSQLSDLKFQIPDPPQSQI
jgi:flagellar protein FliO/FliZ